MLLSKEEKLAHEIAKALDDMDALAMHEKFVRKYSEAHLRKVLMKVLSMPEGSVRNKGALYTSLVQKNDGSRV